METTQARHTWYATRANSNGHGFVIEEATGRDVALVYDSTDAPVLAAAPELLEALKALFEHCEMVHNRWGEDSNLTEANAAIAAGRAAIAKAE